MSRASGLLVLVVGCVWLYSAAAEEPLGKVGIFDFQKIADEIKPGVKVAPGTANRQKPSEEELAKARAGEETVKKEIQRLAQALEQKGLSEEQQAKLEKELSQQRSKLSRARSQRAKLARGEDKEREAFRNQAQAALEKYGKEKGFSALFEKGFLEKAKESKVALLNGTTVDITQEIVDRLKVDPPPSR
jgi:Skp family chaperone for outer membrane proteins